MGSGSKAQNIYPTFGKVEQIELQISSACQPAHENLCSNLEVPKGGTLSAIAKKYRTSVRKLMRWNNISSPHAIRAGQRLVVGYRKDSSRKLPRDASVILVPRYTTLSHLALRYQTSVKKLMSWNGLTNSKQLRTGMRLFVKAPLKDRRKPQKAIVAKTNSSRAPKVRHRIIRVRRGDTLWKIARIYRTTVKKLVSLNELESERFLRPNQKLIVPYRS